MRHFLSVTTSIAVFSLFSAASFAGDCNKTVMGGGCTSQADAGVAPHMKAQPQVVGKSAKVQAVAKPAVTSATSVRAVKVSH